MPRSSLRTRVMSALAVAGSATTKFYRLWSTSFHGLAMQPYTPELARTKLTEQKDEIVAGKYRFLADLRKSVVSRTQLRQGRRATPSCR